MVNKLIDLLYNNKPAYLTKDNDPSYKEVFVDLYTEAIEFIFTNEEIIEFIELNDLATLLALHDVILGFKIPHSVIRTTVGEYLIYDIYSYKIVTFESEDEVRDFARFSADYAGRLLSWYRATNHFGFYCTTPQFYLVVSAEPVTIDSEGKLSDYQNTPIIKWNRGN